MIEITPDIRIDESELQFDFVHASGPGGQNVNKVASAVQLRFDVIHSISLPEDVRQRLMSLAGKRLTTEGVLILDARQTRSQEANRQAALARLIDLIQKAAEKPKSRHSTRPTLASKQRRMQAKRHRGAIKSLRRAALGGDE
jgi:ribosome-associated protein